MLHLFPFSTLILRYVLRASQGKAKHEDEVKQALRTWCGINRYRMLTDAAAFGCALAAAMTRFIERP